MPLKTIRQVADDLGLRSKQSVYALAKTGAFDIVRVVISGRRGVPRVRSEDLDAYKLRLTQADDSAQTTKGAATRRAAASAVVLPRKLQQKRTAVRQATMLSFE